jgi:UDP-N-acetylglucosamine--N-acetylmuramyl-(pentapeptide) pyrophosphoryl-undecaprenol N-acetylglucosamine transferase
MSERTVLMAGGGTGGHVFPLVAVAHALRRLDPEIRPVFVGTARGMETRFVPEQGFELSLLDVLPMRGAGFSGLLRGAARAAALLPESYELLARLKPRAVFSVGGYAAGPVSLAAHLMGIPVALLEPNSVAGLANLLIAPFVERAYVAFDAVERHFPPAVVRRLGVPLRQGFEPVPYEIGSRVRILVLGGSQGAKALNESLPQALARLRQSVQVIHQCGKAHQEAVETLYRELKLDFVTVTPFIEDMPSALANADLVVGRAGAGAVSEIAAVGRPSLLVPYPFASGDHQRINAEYLEKAGAARTVLNQHATPERLASELDALVSDRATLRKMAFSAKNFGRPRAALDVASDFLELAGLRRRAPLGPPTGGEHSVYGALGEVA